MAQWRTPVKTKGRRKQEKQIDEKLQQKFANNRKKKRNSGGGRKSDGQKGACLRRKLNYYFTHPSGLTKLSKATRTKFITRD